MTDWATRWMHCIPVWQVREEVLAQTQRMDGRTPEIGFEFLLGQAWGLWGAMKVMAANR